jgi:hypothetical protein
MPSIINATTTGGVVVSGDNSGSLQLASNNGTTAITVDASQKVGIGTTTPASKLDVFSDTATFGDTGSFNFAINGTNVIFKNGAGGTTERMRIDSSGNVLVGKTSFSDSVVGIQLPNSGLPTFTASQSTGAASTLNIYSTGASAYRFYVDMAGTVFATNTTISGISDQRLKENITDIDVGLDKVMALKPRKFDWKAGKGKDKKGDRGWIAQEFETVFPEMIQTWKDPAPEGEEPYKAVNADLIPILVKAIQELNTKVEAQAVRIAELERA